MFGARMATVPPGSTPRSVSPPASRLTRSMISPAVTARPVGPSMMATSSSRPANPSNSSSVIETAATSTVPWRLGYPVIGTSSPRGPVVARGLRPTERLARPTGQMSSTTVPSLSPDATRSCAAAQSASPPPGTTA